MKVAILTPGRTSSSSLYKSLEKLYNFDVKRSEPYNKSLNYRDYINFNEPFNILTKLIYSEKFLPPDIENLDDFLIWIKDIFTHVICLYRENTLLQSYSLLYHTKMSKFTNDTHKWHEPILINPKIINSKELEYVKSYFDADNLLLKNYSEENNFIYVKYEDLIINEGDNSIFRDICNYINVDFDYDKIYEFYRKENKVTLRREDIKIDKLI